MMENKRAPYARAVVCLLKGIVNASDRVWEDVLHYQTEIQKYLMQIGIELIVKREEGFAYIRQTTDEEGNTVGLVPRKQLGFEISVILVILRQVLEDFDNNLDELYAAECYLTADDIKERVELFLPEKFNRVRLLNELEYIDGKIWANVYTTDLILVIDPESGNVEATVDAAGLLPSRLHGPDTDVLNGIAYDGQSGKIYLTGKNWPLLFEIRLVEKK